MVKSSTILLIAVTSAIVVALLPMLLGKYEPMTPVEGVGHRMSALHVEAAHLIRSGASTGQSVNPETPRPRPGSTSRVISRAASAPRDLVPSTSSRSMSANESLGSVIVSASRTNQSGLSPPALERLVMNDTAQIALSAADKLLRTFLSSGDIPAPNMRATMRLLPWGNAVQKEAATNKAPLGEVEEQIATVAWTFEDEPPSPNLWPLVLTSNLRPQLFIKQTVASLRELRPRHPARRCLFFLHLREDSDPAAAAATFAVARSAKDVCRVKIIALLDTTATSLSSTSWKRLWASLLTWIWDSPSVLGFGQDHTYNGDVFFVDDDIVFAPDSALVVDRMLSLRATLPKVVMLTLSGWGGENMINANPLEVVARRVFPVPTIFYSYNRTSWSWIVASKSEEARLASMTQLMREHEDFGMASLSPLLRRLPDMELLAPSLSRLMHVGQIGMGATGRGGNRAVVEAPLWRDVQLATNVDEIRLRPGGPYDIFGLSCPELSKPMENQPAVMERFCQCGRQRFPPSERHNIFRANGVC